MDRVSDSYVVGLFRMLQEGRFSRDVVPDLLTDLASHAEATPESVAARIVPVPAQRPDVGETVDKLLSGDEWHRDGHDKKEFLLAMGIVMPHLGRLYSGAEVAVKVRELIARQRAA